MIAYLPTTTDNPYDPFDDFDNWYAYDIQHGYRTTETLAYFAATSDDYSDEENQKIVNEAVEKMVHAPYFIEYVKVEREI